MFGFNIIVKIYFWGFDMLKEVFFYGLCRIEWIFFFRGLGWSYWDEINKNFGRVVMMFEGLVERKGIDV